MFSVGVLVFTLLLKSIDSYGHDSSSGSILVWGHDLYGQCSVPEPNEEFIAVAAGGFHNLGLKSDGSIVAWGHNEFGQCEVPEPNTGFTFIACGNYHSMAIHEDGSVVVWGLDGCGTYDVPEPNTGFVAVAGGGGFCLGLKEDSSIVAWGCNNHRQCCIPETALKFISISAGNFHSLALMSDGTILAWGDNGDHQCSVPQPNQDFISVSAGGLHSMALRDDSTIAAWGYNLYGQCDVPEPNSGFISIEAGNKHNLAMRAGGVITAWGYNNVGQCDVPEPNQGFTIISGGMFHSAAVKPELSILENHGEPEGISVCPNPFESMLVIRCMVGSCSCPDLEIFDITGRRVAVITPVMSGEGVFNAYWDGTEDSGLVLPGGVYIVSLKGTGSIHPLHQALVGFHGQVNCKAAFFVAAEKGAEYFHFHRKPCCSFPLLTIPACSAVTIRPGHSFIETIPYNGAETCGSSFLFRSHRVLIGLFVPGTLGRVDDVAFASGALHPAGILIHETYDSINGIQF